MSASRADPDYSMATASRFIGHELGLSDWITVDQERIAQFAVYGAVAKNLMLARFGDSEHNAG